MIAAIETSESGSISRMKYSRAALIHFLLIAATFTGFPSMSVADTVTLTDGTVFKGDILTDTKTEVTMNCKVGAKYEVKKFARSKIKSVVDDAPKVASSGEPKTPPTSTGATSGGSASGGSASKKPPSGAVADPAPSKSGDAASEDVVVVEVVGTGATPEAAFDDAVKSALMQVVGTFSKSYTQIENDQVVLDRIIKHNQGFIESATKQGPAKLKSGQFEVAVTVSVRRGKVVEVLTEAAKTEAAVDGDSLYARIKTMRESKSSAAEILHAVFEGFPANVLKCEVAEGPTQVKLTNQAADEGDVIVQVKVDIEIDKEKYAIWCKGAKEAFSAIATEQKTISWNPKKGGAVKISKKSAKNNSYDGGDFVNSFGWLMSEQTAKAEHLFIKRDSWTQFTQQIEVMSKSVSSSKGKGSKADESLHDGVVTQKDVGFICLLSSAGGSVDVFVIPSEVMGTLDNLDQAPLISTDLLDEAGDTIASVIRPDGDPVLFVKEASQPKAFLFKYTSQYWNSSPTRAFPISNGDKSAAFLISPFSQGIAFNDHTFSSRISIPFWFSIALKDLPNCKKVDVKLGDRAPAQRN